MPITPVNSAAVATVAYDVGSGILQLQFRDGRIYRYAEVPVAVYDGLLHAESKGAFFNRAIRGQFPHTLGSSDAK